MSMYSASSDQIANVMSTIAGSDPSFAAGRPSLALDAAQSQNPDQTATTLAHASAVQNAQDATQTQGSQPGVTGWISDHLGHGPVGTALSWLGKPLQEISDDYKFLHAVYTQYGPGAGILATLGVAGGGVAGFFAGAPLLGAEGAIFAERRLLGNSIWQNAYKLSMDPNYNVSMGRDLANVLGANGQTDSGWGRVVSGIGDTAFDFAADPLIGAARFASAAKMGLSLQVAKDEAGNVVHVLDSTGKSVPIITSKIPLAAHSPGFNQYLQSASLRVFSPDQVDAVFHGNPLSGATRTYHAALKNLAGMDAAGVAIAYPGLSEAAPLIGKANTIEDVHELIKRSLWSADNINLINGPAMLPSRTLLGGRAQVIRDAVTNWGDDAKANQANWFIPKRSINPDTQEKQLLLPATLAWKNVPSAAAKTVRTWTGKRPFYITADNSEVATHTFDLKDPAAYNSVYQMFRFGMGDEMAREHLAAYINAPTLSMRRALIDSGQIETLKKMGLPNDPQLLADVVDGMKKSANGWSMGGPHRAYGFGFETGDKVSMVDHPGVGTSPAALKPFQDDTSATYLDFFAAQRAIRGLHNFSGVMGALDDGVRKHFIESIFKPAALLSGGFALRISASEVLQSMMRYGTVNTLRATVASAAAHMGVKLLPGEDEHILAAMSQSLAHGSELPKLPPPTPEDIRAVLAHAETPASVDPITGQVPESLAKANSYGERVMSKLGDSALKLSNTIDPKRARIAAELIVRGQGHIGTGAVLTGHGGGYGDVDPFEIAQQTMQTEGTRAQALKGQRYSRGQLSWQSSGNFNEYTPDNAAFNTYWKTNVDKASRDQQSKLILGDVLTHMELGKSVDEAWRVAVDKDAARIAGRAYDPSRPRNFGDKLTGKDDVYSKWRTDMSRTQVQDSHTHAFNVADDLRNTVTGRDGTFHRELAQNILNGVKTPMSKFDEIGSTLRPKAQIGPEWVAYNGGNIYKRFVQAGYAKLLDPVINHLSRNPLMLLATEREMKSLDWAVQAGMMDHERAMSIAIQRATHAILPQIHNVANRSQMALMATNLFPFWFAQEQAYRRVGRLAGENPAALRYYQMIENGLSTPGFLRKDSSGNSYLTIPFVGAWGQAAANAASALGVPLVSGLPMDVSGNLASLKSVLPESNLPGVSPLVAIAANELASLVPEMGQNLGVVVGDQNIGASMLDQLIPNSAVRTFLKGVTMPEMDRGVQVATANALAAAYYHGQFPPPDATAQERQAFADRIKNNARSGIFLKAVLGIFSPISPQVAITDPGFRDEFNALVKKTGDYAKAIDLFTASHGDKAISYTIAQSAPTNAKIPYTNEAINWVNANQALISGKYGIGAAYLVPQGGVNGDTQAISDELLKMHLRERRTPQEFMDAVYIAAGNNMIDPGRRTHEANLASFAGDSQKTSDENAAWSKYIQQLRLGNPLWYDNYTSDARRTNALRAVSNLLAVFQDNKDGSLVNEAEPQVQGVKTLLQAFVNHSQLQAQLHQAGAPGSVSAERVNWTDYLDSISGYTKSDGTKVAGSNPEMATVIRSVFLPLAAQNIDLSMIGA